MKERADQVESLKLADALTHVLDECRMVLPGIQALFGFQMIAVFNNGFSEKLTANQQRLHIVAIVFVIVAIGLVMAPAAIHREAEPKAASERFIEVATRLLLAAMIPLAIGLCIDVYVVTAIVWKQDIVPIALALCLFLYLAAIWFVYPSLYRKRAR